MAHSHNPKSASGKRAGVEMENRRQHILSHCGSIATRSIGHFYAVGLTPRNVNMIEPNGGGGHYGAWRGTEEGGIDPGASARDKCVSTTHRPGGYGFGRQIAHCGIWLKNAMDERDIGLYDNFYAHRKENI